MTGSIPSELGKCTRLTFFAGGNNHFTGTLPIELGNLANLVHLDLAINIALAGTVPQEYTKLEKLEIFEIWDTAITGTIPSGICEQGFDHTVIRVDGYIEYTSCSCCQLTY